MDGTGNDLVGNRIGELAHLLLIQDLQASRPFGELRNLLGGSCWAEMNSIEEQINRLNFKRALDLLNELANVLGVSSEPAEKRSKLMLIQEQEMND
jgi:hypothetical protein